MNAIFLDVISCGSRKKEPTFQKNVPPKRWFLQEPRRITAQETAFFIVTTMNSSNLIVT
jgi:hypothetical protein